MSLGRQRLDKWLFFARIAKSRTLAAKIIQSGSVRLNRNKVDQPAQAVGSGDVLTITLERRILVLKIVDTGTRRGPAPEAQALYEDLSEPPPPREARPAGREPGAGRPTKADRRRIDRLMGGD